MFEEVIAEYSPKCTININLHTQETESIPNRRNTKKISDSGTSVKTA